MASGSLSSSTVMQHERDLVLVANPHDGRGARSAPENGASWPGTISQRDLTVRPSLARKTDKRGEEYHSGPAVVLHSTAEERVRRPCTIPVLSWPRQSCKSIHVKVSTPTLAPIGASREGTRHCGGRHPLDHDGRRGVHRDESSQHCRSIEGRGLRSVLHAWPPGERAPNRTDVRRGSVSPGAGRPDSGIGS